MKKNKNRNRLQLPISLWLLTAACGGDGGHGDAQHLDVDLNAVTSDSVLMKVSCGVEYTADIGGDEDHKEGVVRKIVVDYSSSTIGRLTFQALSQDRDLLGDELTDDVSESIDSIPEYHGKLWFDIACGEVELANP